jgi:hypothetical protein
MLLPPFHGIEKLGQPQMGSIYDEVGTPDSGYAETGPYHCEDCVHKTAPDEPFCIHPKVVGDHDLQDKLVQIDGRPAVKVNLEHGCCRFVRPPAKPIEMEEKHEAHDESHE